MQSQEQQLIDGLFSRLKEAERQSVPRDADAERAITGHVDRQPAAPYYMAQTILIQEAALKQLEQRVRDLETQAERNRQPATEQSSGGFLAGLFGSGQREEARQPRAGGGWNEPGSRSGIGNVSGFRQSPPPTGSNFGGARAGSGFLGGALQTAAGVAGGLVLGNMLMDMFGQSQPEEIVNVINDAPPVDDLQGQDFAGTDMGQDFNDQGGGGFQDAGADEGDFGDAGGIFGDDDSFI
ncbi:DUF2076 domain-containing protein [Pseudomonas matsuisoli]|uniref:DUF2076 domain-containing protein n=1 Tax=Pseudomonas matsuisoli TaxID=1515666 RepID=A0A917PY58_9PSED|nr:DUF2076 domain-containing protein [Pseudomonas matsuisoli]GGK00420.1 hypothetical protein GCM10009304_27750 [Pseudomonas matsuisoli]